MKLGHAILAFILKAGLKSGSIVFHEDSLGRIIQDYRPIRGRDHHRAAMRFLKRLQNNCIILVGGFVAEQLLMREYSWEGKEYEEAMSHAEKLRDLNQTVEDLCLTWIAGASVHLESNWRVVKALAEVLLIYKELNCKETRMIIRLAMARSEYERDFGYPDNFLRIAF